MPSLSRSLTFSTRPFFVETRWERRTTARASAYDAPAPTAASTAALQRSRTARTLTAATLTAPQALVAELVDALG